MLYLITPHFKNLKEPNWEVFQRLLKKLDQSERKVADIYEIELEYIAWAQFIKPQLPGFISERQQNSAKGAAINEEKESDFAMCLAEKMTE